MPLLPADELRRLLRAIYEGAGVPDEEARVVAEYQVDANLAGHDSHGALLTGGYIERIDKGHIVPGATIDVLSETATTAVVDGNWGFGFVVTQRVTEMVAEKAAQHGIAAMTVRRQGHVGRLGAYSARLAAADAIGLVTADSGLGPKHVAPFGGSDRRLGTNPLSISVPSDLEGPVILDMATSAVAVGKLKVARNSGVQMPSPVIIGRDGQPSKDPAAFFDGGALLPLGGDQAYKGYGLSFMVEVLSGLLTGIGFGIDPKGRHNDGVVVAAFNVASFRDLGEFKKEVHDFVDYLKESPPAAGFSEVLYPGEIEHRTRLARLADGISIDDTTWGELMALCDRFGVSP